MLFGIKDSNLGCMVQSHVPYRLANPECVRVLQACRPTRIRTETMPSYKKGSTNRCAIGLSGWSESNTRSSQSK